MIRYLRRTSELEMTLRASSTPVFKWWVYGSHIIHPNMRGYTGKFMSLGRGMPITGSNNQKLNTHSSTETKLIDSDHFMPNILFNNYFF